MHFKCMENINVRKNQQIESCVIQIACLSLAKSAWWNHCKTFFSALDHLMVNSILKRQNSIINLCHNRPEINVSVFNLDNWKQIELRKLLLLTVVKKQTKKINKTTNKQLRLINQSQELLTSITGVTTCLCAIKPVNVIRSVRKCFGLEITGENFINKIYCQQQWIFLWNCLKRTVFLWNRMRKVI